VDNTISLVLLGKLKCHNTKELIMTVSKICESYFNGFQKIFDYKKNDFSTNAAAICKIVSYFTMLIPLSFALVYGVSTLVNRCRHQKQNLSLIEKKVNLQFEKILGKNSSITLKDIWGAYKSRFMPNKNKKNLENYFTSEDYQRHSKTAQIYYNSKQLSQNDALKIAFQREPTNITMGSNQYNKEKLKEAFKYEKGIYNQENAKKEDGSLFKDLPNTVSIYSETYLWSTPGGDDKKEIACLSLPAPALDTSYQPHYLYYMNEGKLDREKYSGEMSFLFKTIETTVRDHNKSAFNGTGLHRVVIPKFGQGAFLGELSGDDRKIANEVFKEQLLKFLENISDIELKIVMSAYSENEVDTSLTIKTIIGDILETSQEGDLIVNAWDPHSAPGNGNDSDPSFDGAMGKGSGILLTQTAWLNEQLKNENSLVGVN
jgi:hypothetical protein